MKNSLITWYNNKTIDLQTDSIKDSTRIQELQMGDTIHCFVPKSFLRLIPDSNGVPQLGANFETDYQINLYGWNSCPTPTGNPYIKIQTTSVQNSGLKVQSSENITEFKIYVGSAPDGITFKQFAILNEKDQEILPTFRSQTSDFDKYMVELKKHFEYNPLVACFCEIEGNFMTVKVRHNSGWMYRNEKFKVGLGTVIDENTNTPSLTAFLVNTVSIPATNRYKLQVLDDIVEGNVFVFKGKTYISNNNDTPESIIKALTGGADEFNSDNLSNIYTELGKTTIKNTNNINFRLIYNSNSGGNDLYTLEGSNFVEGNILEVLVDGLSFKRYVVKANDTITEIRNFFYTSGFIYASDTSSVDVAYSQGQRSITNTNSPGFNISLLATFPARTVDNYEITVGTSIVSGNIFTLNDKEVIATDLDDFESIRAKLGLETGEYFQITTGTQFDCTAAKGFKYDDDNIADVEVVSGGVVKESDMLMCIIDVPTLSNSTINNPCRFVIESSINSGISTEPRLYSQYFDIVPKSDYVRDNIIAFRDKGKVLGFDYFDPLFYQKFRFPFELSNDTIEVSEEVSTNIDGTKNRNTTSIAKKQELKTKAINEHKADALIVALSHKEVFINNIPYVISDIKKELVSHQSKLFIVSANCYPQNEPLSNINTLDSITFEYQDTVKIKAINTLDILSIGFVNNDFEKNIKGTEEMVSEPFESFVTVNLAYENFKI